MQPKYELLNDIHKIVPGDVLIEYPISGPATFNSFNAKDRLNQQKWQVTEQHDDSIELSVPQEELMQIMECGLIIDDTPITKNICELISERIWWISRKRTNKRNSSSNLTKT